VNFTKNNQLACCSAISRRKLVTTVADCTNQKCAQLQHNFCVAWIHTCKKKVYLHIQKVKSVFYNSKQVTYTCRYISGVLANPSLGKLALPATVAQGKPKSPVLQLHTHTGLAPAVSNGTADTCHSVTIQTPRALGEIHKGIPKVPKHQQILGGGGGGSSIKKNIQPPQCSKEILIN
jgi:hypothetical protein